VLLIEPIQELDLISIQQDLPVIFQLFKQPGYNHSGGRKLVCDLIMGAFYQAGAGYPLLFFEVGNQPVVQLVKGDAFNRS